MSTISKLFNTKIHVSTIALLLACLIVIKPQYFAEAGENVFIQTWSYYCRFFLALALVVALIVRRFRGHKVSPIFKLTIGLYAWYLLCAWLGGDNSLSDLSVYISILSVCALFEVSGKKLPTCLRTLRLVLEIYTFINLLTVLLYPNGMYAWQIVDSNEYRTDCWFFGFRNNHLWLLLPSMLVSCLCDYMDYSRLKARSILICCMVGITSFLIGSATALTVVSVTLAFFIMFVYFLPSGLERLAIWIPPIIVIAGFICIVFLGSTNVVSMLAETLGRDSTFTGRTVIWRAALQAIVSNFWIGVGDSSIRVTDTFIATHPHNEVLNILLNGGLIGLVIFTILSFSAGRQLMRCHRSEIVILFAAVLSGYAAASISESFTYFSMLIPILNLAACLPNAAIPFGGLGEAGHS